MSRFVIREVSGYQIVPGRITPGLSVERPMPAVKLLCSRCDVREDDVASCFVVVSPRGTAHYGVTSGDTHCGIDATGPKWWWPL